MQGVSTRKVKQVTEELVGYAFSASPISAINKRLWMLAQSVRSPICSLTPATRGSGRMAFIASQAVLIAIGVDWKAGARCLRSSQPGEPVELEGVSGGAEDARPSRRRVRHLR